jgi:hypothetical protein
MGGFMSRLTVKSRLAVIRSRGPVAGGSVGVAFLVSLLGPLVGALLGACSHQAPLVVAGDDSEINTPPTDYRREIVAAMHAYLADPTGIRDAEIATPAIKAVGNLQRYVVCVRFNAKKRGEQYAGVKEIAAVFMVGRFDRFVEKAQEHSVDKALEQCAGATYAPFPELQKLTR